MGSYWPLFDLELRTARLVLRLPRDEDFGALLDAIDAGIHDPDVMPFAQPWTDADPVSRRRSAAQFWWMSRASWHADNWHLPLAVLHEGAPIGIQSLFAKDFPVLREVGTGSWLTRSFQGQGLGREMRAAVLQLAFEGLGALVARSGAFVDNHPSTAVSRALGYRENGRYREAPRGEPRVMVNFELTREEWLSREGALPRTDIVGFGEALTMFSITGPKRSP